MFARGNERSKLEISDIETEMGEKEQDRSSRIQPNIFFIFIVLNMGLKPELSCRKNQKQPNTPNQLEIPMAIPNAKTVSILMKTHEHKENNQLILIIMTKLIIIIFIHFPPPFTSMLVKYVIYMVPLWWCDTFHFCFELFLRHNENIVGKRHV